MLKNQFPSKRVNIELIHNHSILSKYSLTIFIQEKKLSWQFNRKQVKRDFGATDRDN